MYAGLLFVTRATWKTSGRRQTFAKSSHETLGNNLLIPRVGFEKPEKIFLPVVCWLSFEPPEKEKLFFLKNGTASNLDIVLLLH